MPIIGLTDRTPSFKECGRLRLGIPKNQMKAGPQEIGYFRADFRPDAESAAAAFSAAYGNQPTRINVRLPFTEISRMWDAYYMVYNKAGLLGMADGERWIYLRSNVTSELLVKDGMPSHPENLPVDSSGLPYMPFDKSMPVYSYKSGKGADVAVYARPEGRLKILVPELNQAAYMVLITHSIYNVMKFTEQLSAIEQIAKNAGVPLPMVPVVLSRRKELISVTIDGKKAMQEHYLCNLEIDPTWMEAQWKYIARLLPGTIAPTFQLALPEPTPEQLIEAEPDEIIEQEKVPAAAQPLTIEEAVARSTPKGTLLGSLTDEKLKVVAEKAGNGLAEAANFLLANATDEDFSVWFTLFSGSIPVSVVTRIQLYREIQKAQQPA